MGANKNKYIYIFQGIIFFISFSSAFSLGISPTEHTLKGETKELICKEFFINSDENLTFNVEIAFSNKETKDLKDYILKPETFSIQTFYEEKVIKGIQKVCIISEYGGKYYGVVKYKINDANYGIVTWIKLDISGSSKISLITGKAIAEIREKNYDLWFIFISLIIIFILLVISVFKKKN